MTDRELIDKSVRTNLKLINQLNRNPEMEGLFFRRELLARGVEVLQLKTSLTELDRSNLRRFNEKWSLEPD